MINWKVRLKNPTFWTGLVSIIVTLAISIAQLFGVDISAVANEWQQAIIAFITAVFGILALVGVIADPTTKGISDSTQAMTYTEPKDY